MTVEQIQTELTAVNDAILRITGAKSGSYSIGGRQVSLEPANKLEALYKRQAELELKLSRAQRGGIRVRSGVPAR